jgi:hypothetical protein
VAFRGKGDLNGAATDFQLAIGLNPSFAALLPPAQR